MWAMILKLRICETSMRDPVYDVFLSRARYGLPQKKYTHTLYPSVLCGNMENLACEKGDDAAGTKPSVGEIIACKGPLSNSGLLASHTLHTSCFPWLVLCGINGLRRYPYSRTCILPCSRWRGGVSPCGDT